MTDLPTYRAHSVPDLLNLIPVLFGFKPQESLIGICLEGESHRFGFRLRIDIPDESGDEEVAARVAALLDENPSDAVILLAITERRARGDILVQKTADMIHHKHVAMALCASATRWWEAGATETQEWRVDPFHESIVRAVREGQVIKADRAEVEREFVPSPEAIEYVQMERWQHSFIVPGEQSLSIGIEQRIEATTQTLDLLRRQLVPEPKEIGDAAIALRNVLVRDHFWFTIDTQNARTELAVWTHVARLLNGPWRCAPLSLAAFSAWQAGDGVRMSIAVEAALREDPQYSMANLLQRVVEQGLGPETWRQFRTDSQRAS
ncbi:MAG: DUF4192 domain-containing protein [Aeromicrobium sp.]|nr:MAG: DUF4192 domain-containing protein [Aeromicrobium sp.]